MKWLNQEPLGFSASTLQSIEPPRCFSPFPTFDQHFLSPLPPRNTLRTPNSSHLMPQQIDGHCPTHNSHRLCLQVYNTTATQTWKTKGRKEGSTKQQNTKQLFKLTWEQSLPFVKKKLTLVLMALTTEQMGVTVQPPSKKSTFLTPRIGAQVRTAVASTLHSIHPNP